jgi:CYTH domain-containing protein
VDVFPWENVGLIIAELELASEDEDFEKPDWLGVEVTGRPEYYNSNLVKLYYFLKMEVYGRIVECKSYKILILNC